MEMYIVHTCSSDFNVSNSQIVQADNQFVLTTDITRILPSKPTVFDSDYIPYTKPEPLDEANTPSFALMESLGSSLGEIIFPAPVKQETPEAVQKTISTHSPTYQLCLQITDVDSMAATNLPSHTAPHRDLDWSLDANALTSIDKAIDSHKSPSLSSHERHYITPSNSQENSNYDTYTTSQEDTNLQEVTLNSPLTDDATNTVCTVSDANTNSSSHELTNVSPQSRHSSQEITDANPPTTKVKTSLRK